MREKMFRFLCIACVFSVLNFFSGCTSKSDMVTDQDIIELYNENKELFERTAEEVEKIEKKLQPEIDGLTFTNEERLSAYLNNTKISFNFPDELSSDLIDCFIEMDSIINESYDEDEYVLWISNNTIVSSYGGDINVTQFAFSNDVIGSTLALTYSEDKPGDSDIIINDNWYITWWGRV